MKNPTEQAKELIKDNNWILEELYQVDDDEKYELL